MHVAARLQQILGKPTRIAAHDFYKNSGLWRKESVTGCMGTKVL
jgi:hypothetical protein